MKKLPVTTVYVAPGSALLSASNDREEYLPYTPEILQFLRSLITVKHVSFPNGRKYYKEVLTGECVTAFYGAHYHVVTPCGNAIVQYDSVWSGPGADFGIHGYCSRDKVLVDLL